MDRIQIKNHRQVMIDGVYGYTANEARTRARRFRLLFSWTAHLIFVSKGRFLSLNSITATPMLPLAYALRVALKQSRLTFSLGAGGIGVLNNSTAASISIFVDIKLKTSRRNSSWVGPLIPVVDNVAGVTYISNDLGAQQDRIMTANSKVFSSSYPVAHRLQSDALGQLITGAYKIAGKNSNGVIVNTAIIRSDFSSNTAGAENSNLSPHSSLVVGLSGRDGVYRLRP